MKFNIELTPDQLLNLRALFQLLAFDRKYWEIPWDNYIALEAIIKTINDQEPAAMPVLEVKQSDDWKEQKCSNCGHNFWAHCGRGLGHLCCVESCNCFVCKS